MNLEEVIHTRWAAVPALNNLLDSSRVMTGAYREQEEPEFPYGVIRTFEDKAAAANDRVLWDVQIEVIVSHRWDQYDAGKAIMDQVKLAFNRIRLALGDDATAVLIAPQSYQSIQDDDSGAWDFMLTLGCKVDTPLGV